MDSDEPKPVPRGTSLPPLSGRLRLAIAALLLLGVNLGVFLPITGFDFVDFDDPQYVVDNPHVRGGLTLEGLGWAFSTGYAATWQPLTWISFQIDAQLFGMGPKGFHTTNLVLHIANAILVFSLLQGWTGSWAAALIVALLYSIHPLRVESVAWITERKDVLSGFFGLLSLLSYSEFTRRRDSSVSRSPGGRSSAALAYGLTFLFLALGLLAKPVLVTWPFVFLLFDFSMRAQRNPSIPSKGIMLLEKLPFLLLVCGSSLLTLMVQEEGGALPDADRLPLLSRLANAVVSYAWYLERTFLPRDLCAFYPHPSLPGSPPLTTGTLIVSSAILLAVTVCLLIAKRRPLLFGWFFFLGTLFPMIGIIQTGSHARADRFTYLPQIGLLMAFVLLIAEGCRRLPGKPSLVRIGIGIVCATATLVLGFRARGQGETWRDSITLFEHALATGNESATVHTWLGQSLDKRDRPQDAISHYRRALVLNPYLPRAHSLLGALLHRQGNVDLAVLHLNQAIQIRPGSAGTHNNLGSALYTAGDPAAALLEFEKALRIDPDLASAHHNRGIVLRDSGRWNEALESLRRAKNLVPDSSQFEESLQETLRMRP